MVLARISRMKWLMIFIRAYRGSIEGPLIATKTGEK
jgi:hypothetical protein